MKLQSILFPNSNICNEEALYLHKDESFLLFDGFFNLFYLEKHHKYCLIDKLSLELELRGISKIVLMHDRDVLKEVGIEKTFISGIERLKDQGGDTERNTRVSIELPYNEYERGVFWFKAQIADDREEFFLQGHYDGYGKSEVKTPEIAVNICTFRREAYVTRNMRSLVSFLNEKDLDGRYQEVKEHMRVFIIDNGQTLLNDTDFLDATKGFLSDDEQTSKIRVIPNANTGGTGGFSRGMQEAMNLREKLGLTHILMMDDDAVFDPDMFVRLYGFLFMLKKEYEGITVGGALMREDFRYIQHAAGEWYKEFRVMNDHLIVDLRSFDTCTGKWMTTPENEHPVYGAWWCCCYHMDAVTKEKMPLPIFVHHDDIQFGLSNLDRGIVFLNGICVWHQGFELVFPGVKQYYNMRNTLITSYFNEPGFLKRKMKLWSIKRYIGMLISYRYGDCHFVYRGMMDFLKGKEWLLSTDPESLHKELMREYASICPKLPYDQIEKYVKNIDNKLSPAQVREYYTRERFKGTLPKKISFNGWFLPADNEIKVITPLDSPWDTYRHKNILLYEPGSGNGYLAKRSNKEFFKGLLRMLRMCIAIDTWKAKGGKW